MHVSSTASPYERRTEAAQASRDARQLSYAGVSMTGGTDGAAAALGAGLWGVVVWGVVLMCCDNGIISSRVGH